ncbi:hypothetical protein FHR80_003713 [Cellulomonas cellasea]|uniref:Uncharacterized protein n=1 Tax=Cellulomonas cellasea TaxID=43670 RepID=A0A7W4UIG4_9CELL|nr:hypothetical protein [Cellulomonas cellasea]
MPHGALGYVVGRREALPAGGSLGDLGRRRERVRVDDRGQPDGARTGERANVTKM